MGPSRAARRRGSLGLVEVAHEARLKALLQCTDRRGRVRQEERAAPCVCERLCFEEEEEEEEDEDEEEEKEVEDEE